MPIIKYKKNDSWGNLILDAVYPIGSFYISADSTSPSAKFGGTWVQIKDRMIMACGDTYANESTGGSATTTIASANLPKHTHSVGAHSHGLNGHTHSVPEHGHGNNISFGVNSSGYIQNGISGGWHTHGVYFYNIGWGDSNNSIIGTSGVNHGNTATTSTQHWHDLPNHTHSLTKSGGVSNCGAFNTGGNSGSTANSAAFNTSDGGFSNTAMTTISPYYSAYVWKRTA